MESKTIKSIRRIKSKDLKVYNLEINRNNNYIANKILVHNCDDPNNVLEAESALIREGTNDWHDFVMSTRYAGTIDQFRRLVIQQRVHERDVSGNILSKNDDRWIHLRLPMKYEASYKCMTIPLPMTDEEVWGDPREKEGDLLWPQGISEERYKEIVQKDFRNDSYREAGQMQQRPSPAGGGILKTEWFKSGGIICDVGYPKNISYAPVTRQDILIFSGGLTKSPTPIMFPVDTGQIGRAHV